jgi:Ser/Thr protein kinase RdoA (MazF antagonist)
LEIYQINELILNNSRNLESVSIDLPTTILHGDWHPGNQLYQKNGEVCCILDFDSIQRGECVFDVAYALYFYLLKDKSEALGKPFLQGYGVLSEQEQMVLPVMIAKLGLFFGSFINKGDLELSKRCKIWSDRILHANTGILLNLKLASSQLTLSFLSCHFVGFISYISEVYLCESKYYYSVLQCM